VDTRTIGKSSIYAELIISKKDATELRDISACCEQAFVIGKLHLGFLKQSTPLYKDLGMSVNENLCDRLILQE
jgi:hypothetical protein